MKARWRRIRPYLLSGPIYWLLRLAGLTLRIEAEGYEAVQKLPCGRIYAGWHGKTFGAALFFRDKGLWTIISHSRDGEMQNRIFERLGYRTIRGSTKRGGVKAAIESIRVLRANGEMAFTPDGPRGPTGVVQSGILLMAQKSGAAIVPVGVSASRKWNAPTWDHYMVPLPFATVLMLFGQPHYVAAESTPEEVEAVRQSVEAEMHRLDAEADRRFRP